MADLVEHVCRNDAFERDGRNSRVPMSDAATLGMFHGGYVSCQKKKKKAKATEGNSYISLDAGKAR